jgi:flagellar assembly factor FliW
VYSIVVVPEDIRKMTANLMAPVVINNRLKLGKQIVLDNNIYKTKHYIFEEIRDAG